MRRNFLPAWAALCCLATAVADGRSVVINQNPRPAAVLQSGRRVVVQDAPDGVALYDRTGTAVRRFSTAGSDVSAIAVTSDEARLLVGCDDGSLWLFDLQAGGAVWVKTGEGTGLGYVYDVSFAWGGTALVACGHLDGALVYATLTGLPLGSGRIRPPGSMPMAAALAPDGLTGALVETAPGSRVFTFDVASGAVQDTGLTGMWPLRISSDGRYMAFRNTAQTGADSLHVVPLPNPWPAKLIPVGDFQSFEYIRPTADGRFNVTARSAGSEVLGLVCNPATGTLHQIWSQVSPSAELLRADFEVGAMVGVFTRYDLMTTVFDLRQGAPRLFVDNTQAWRAGLVTEQAQVTAEARLAAAAGPEWVWGTAAGILALVLAGAALFVRRHRAVGATS